MAKTASFCYDRINHKGVTVVSCHHGNEGISFISCDCIVIFVFLDFVGFLVFRECSFQFLNSHLNRKEFEAFFLLPWKWGNFFYYYIILTLYIIVKV